MTCLGFNFKSIVDISVHVFACARLQERRSAPGRSLTRRRRASTIEISGQRARGVEEVVLGRPFEIKRRKGPNTMMSGNFERIVLSARSLRPPGSAALSRGEMTIFDARCANSAYASGGNRSTMRALIWSRTCRYDSSFESLFSPRPTGSMVGQYSTSKDR